MWSAQKLYLSLLFPHLCSDLLWTMAHLVAGHHLNRSIYLTSCKGWRERQYKQTTFHSTDFYFLSTAILNNATSVGLTEELKFNCAVSICAINILGCKKIPCPLIFETEFKLSHATILKDGIKFILSREQWLKWGRFLFFYNPT